NIKSDRISRLTVKDLAWLNRSEFVCIVMPLTTVDSKKAASEGGKLLGLQGEMVALEGGKAIVVQDAVANLRRVANAIAKLEGRPAQFDEDRSPPKAKENEKPPPKAKSPEKRFTFSMDRQPWRKVLEWLADRAELPLTYTDALPDGTFTCVPPKDA